MWNARSSSQSIPGDAFASRGFADCAVSVAELEWNPGSTAQPPEDDGHLDAVDHEAYRAQHGTA